MGEASMLQIYRRLDSWLGEDCGLLTKRAVRYMTILPTFLDNLRTMLQRLTIRDIAELCMTAMRNERLYLPGPWRFIGLSTIQLFIDGTANDWGIAWAL